MLSVLSAVPQFSEVFQRVISNYAVNCIHQWCTNVFSGVVVLQGTDKYFVTATMLGDKRLRAVIAIVKGT